MRTTALVGLITMAFSAGAFAIACGGDGHSDFEVDGGGNDPGSSGNQASGNAGGSSSGGFELPDGSTSGGSSSGGPTCATATATTERQPLYLDIILDGSGSMDGLGSRNDPNNVCEATYNQALCFLANAREPDPLHPQGRLTGKKWLAARDALKAYFDASAAVASPSLGVGLYLFINDGSRSEPLRMLDTTQAAALWDHIKPNTYPFSGTPLLSAITTRANYLRGFVPAEPLQSDGRRAIVLITDGVPDGVGGGSKDQVRDAVSAALAGEPSVATAVIGVGSPTASTTVYDATFLSQLGHRGGVGPAGCDENWTPNSGTTSCHLQVTPGEKTAEQLRQEIAAAINAIAGSLASCELTLDKSSPIDPSKVNVLYVDSQGTETQIPQNGDDGWTYDNDEDPSRVILHGQSCERLKSDDGQVNIVVGCPTGTDVVN